MQASCGLDPSLRPLAHPEAFSGANESVGFLRNFGRAGELASMALRDRSGHGRLLTVEVTTRARLRSPAAAWQVRRAQ
jgi:hypothetical protein